MIARPYCAATPATSRRRNFSSSRASPTSTWTLLATSSCACSISRIAWPPVDQLAASNRSFGVCMATSRFVRFARKYSSSIPKEYSGASSRPVAERITRCPASRSRSSRSIFRICGSNRMSLQPCFEKGGLPQPGVSFRAHFSFRILQHVIDEGSLVQTALPCAWRGQHVADVSQKRPAQIAQRGYREITFRPVDDFVMHMAASRLLQNVFAAVPDLQPGRNARRQFDDLVVEEAHPRFEAVCHGHVVDPFDGVVDQHDLGIDLQRFVHCRRGTG